jgi:hypothetical protein
MKIYFDQKPVLFLALIALLTVACTPIVGILPTTTLPVPSLLPSRMITEQSPLLSMEITTDVPLSTLPAASGKILPDDGDIVVYVRSGPGTTYDRIGSLPVGKEVQVTGRSPHGDWWRVYADGVEGWIFSSYIIVEGNVQIVPCVSGAAGDCGASESPIGNDQAIASICVMLDNSNISLSFQEEKGNPNADLRKSLIYTDEQGGEYWVDQQTLQVVRWTAGQTGSSGEVKTIAALRTLAKTFAMRQSPRFRQNSGSLTFTETSKDGTTYAFRWEDRTLPGHVLFPFLQVVIRTDGQIINYHNTLDIFGK